LLIHDLDFLSDAGKRILDEILKEDNHLFLRVVLTQCAGVLDIRSTDGGTLLHSAAFFKATRCVQVLLENGMDPNLADDTGNVPLFYSCMHAQASIMLVLLEFGANPNAKCNLGRTAIHHAAAKGSVTCISLLVQEGADINARDDKGLTALEVAEFKKNKITAEFLRKNIAVQQDGR